MLPIEYKEDEAGSRKLANILVFKADEIKSIEEKTGGRFIYKEELEEYNKWKDGKNSNGKPELPTHKVQNPDRRREIAIKQALNAEKKTPVIKLKPDRISRNKIDSITYLRNEYTNQSGQGQFVCQICKEEMPFKKRDGNYYFEGQEIFDDEHFLYEIKVMYLALCPTCAAKYKEFVFINPNKTSMEDIKQLLLDTESTDPVEIPILMGKEKASISFVESHFIDIQASLQAIEMKRDDTNA
jgi:hypothetical protein